MHILFRNTKTHSLTSCCNVSWPNDWGDLRKTMNMNDKKYRVQSNVKIGATEGDRKL